MHLRHVAPRGEVPAAPAATAPGAASRYPTPSRAGSAAFVAGGRHTPRLTERGCPLAALCSGAK